MQNELQICNMSGW